MHFGDKKHLKSAVLEIIIYKHTDLTVEYVKDIYNYELCSIYHAKYIDAYTVIELWDNFEKLFAKQLSKIEPEIFYHILLKYELKKKTLKFKWVKETQLTKEMFEKDQFLGLH